MAVNFSEIEDFRAPELVVEVEGCVIPKVLVDGGSGVNLMLEDTAYDLGYTTFEETDQVLQMADQSRVISAGRLSQVPTRIGEVTYLQNFLIIRVSSGRPFPMLLGRPWLYSAKVLVDWGSREFVIGKPPVRIPWKQERHLGETSHSDGYTSRWSSPKDSDTSSSYFVDLFSTTKEADFGFSEPLPEIPDQNDDIRNLESPRQEDKSLGGPNLSLTIDWVRGQISSGELPTVGLNKGKPGLPWSGIGSNPDSRESERIRGIVNPTDYKKMEVGEDKVFYHGKGLTTKERAEYKVLLEEFSDVFAWKPSDLKGIPSELGEHHIEFNDDFVSVRQRQYRLNPRYSLMVKDEIPQNGGRMPSIGCLSDCATHPEPSKD